MTEAEWLACDDPARMLSWLQGEDLRGNRLYPASAHKLRLFSCAFWSWHANLDRYSFTGLLAAVDYAERIADDLALPIVGCTYTVAGRDAGGAAQHVVEAATEWTERGKEGQPRKEARQIAAALLREVFGNPFEPARYETSTVELPSNTATKQVMVSYKNGINPVWLSSTVVSLATAIYQERAFERMPILADALEEAGCTDGSVLNHCRGLCPACTDKTGFCWGKVADCRVCGGSGEAGLHVRGCWVIDLILGKS